MPPKKDKKAKAPPKQVIIGEYNLSEMSLSELQGFVYRLQEEVEKCRDVLAFHEVEKNRIEEMAEITKNELEEKTAEVLKKNKEIEDLSREFEKKGVERNQKLKFLEYERKRKMGELKVKSSRIYNDTTEELQVEKIQNFKQLQKEQKNLEDIQDSYEYKVEALNKMSHKYVQTMVLYREEKLKETIQSYENMYEELKKNLRLLKDVETHEYEEQKRKECRNYIERQTKTLNEMKEYFKDITGGSLALIDVLKTEIATLKLNDTIMKQSRKQIEEQNELLRPIVKEARACKISLAHLEQDKKSDQFTRRQVTEYSIRKKDIMEQNKAFQLEYDKVFARMSDLKVKFVSKLRDIEKKLWVKNDILQQKVDELIDVLCQKGVPKSILELEDVDYADCYNEIRTSGLNLS